MFDTLNRFDHYILGIPKLDVCHKSLADSIDAVRIAINGQDFDACRQVLKQLREKLVDHFEYEENLMRGIEYPFYEFHKEHHKMQMYKLDMLLKHGDGGLENDAIDELETIVYTHITNYDSQIAHFLNN